MIQFDRQSIAFTKVAIYKRDTQKITRISIKGQVLYHPQCSVYLSQVVAVREVTITVTQNLSTEKSYQSNIKPKGTREIHCNENTSNLSTTKSTKACCYYSYRMLDMAQQSSADQTMSSHICLIIRVLISFEDTVVILLKTFIFPARF